MHDKKDRKTYMREYMQEYRRNNKDKLKKIRLDYYRRTLEKEEEKGKFCTIMKLECRFWIEGMGCCTTPSICKWFNERIEGKEESE